MGQVPEKSLLLIGNGRLAQHFRFYFKSLNLTVQTWSRAENSVSDLHFLVEQAPRILLAISDRSIEGFFNETLLPKPQTYKQIIHFSGTYHHPQLIACHPLMSFGPQLYDADFYKKIHFVLTGADHLDEIFPELPNPYSILNAEQKPLYHALCVLGGNLPILLWERMRQGLNAMDIPESAQKIYLQKILENYQSFGLQALTGPLVRKDIITIEKNLKALKNDSFEKVYHSFWEAYRELN